jgi:outer membrane protein assembly factor BamA
MTSRPRAGRARFGYRTLLLLALAGAGTPTVQAQAQAPVVTAVRVEEEGRPVSDRAVTELLSTAVGQPLSMVQVRESIAHLMTLSTLDDVQVSSEPSAGGVELRYVLVPLHPVDRLMFRGALGLPEGDLRRVVSDQFGDPPRAGQATAIIEALTRTYRERGYPAATVSIALDETHQPDRATMVITAQSQARVTVASVRFEDVDTTAPGAPAERPAVRQGQVYDRSVVERQLRSWEEGLRGRGYYEARATHTVTFSDDGAHVAVNLVRGSRVVVAFAGDPLPDSERERLVPVRSEASVDEDLLEDSSLQIENYFKARGYRDANVAYTRDERDGLLTITFTVSRGARYTVGDLQVAGSTAVPAAELRALIRLKNGDPFVQGILDGGIGAILRRYLELGYTAAQVQQPRDLPVMQQDASGGRRVAVTLTVVEGARTVVRGVALEGRTAIDEAVVRGWLTTAPGRPFSESALAADRDRVEVEYRNRGYGTVTVTPSAARAETGSEVDVRLTIVEGPRFVVDHVIVVGNRRTSRETIERELLLQPGEPMGLSDRLESRARLSALGLFRRVEVEEVRHGSAGRADLLVRVEESKPTSIGGGGGLEGGFRLRPTGENGQAEERFELAPRGFFEIGRRNLWGSNRSVNLFTRVSLRNRDSVLDESGVLLPDSLRDSRYGFNEYRVVGTFREPQIAGTRAALLVTGIMQQAIRSSFNFIQREARAEAGMAISPVYNVAGRYTLSRTELFDEVFTEEESPLIDRLFPQVRLSLLSGSFLRNTRDDLLDASRGSAITVDADLAMRAIGSEVGFAKMSVQSFLYRRLPTARRVVVALGARFGAAQGFPRQVSRTAADGSTIVETVEDLPANRRFFAGGDTTVRGFSLDRLGDFFGPDDPRNTISQSGFPTGGNGVVIFNSELRVSLLGPLQGVMFVDAGNVVKNASNLSLFELRPSAGGGVRYRSPVGPIRIDLGFNLDRRDLPPDAATGATRRERGLVWHISLGQAF